jgi:hypothetical protein
MSMKRFFDNDGSTLLLGLAALGFLIVPLLAIMLYVSQLTSATTVARGSAFSTAYSSLSDSIDYEATLTSGQTQLDAAGTPATDNAELRAAEAVTYTWNYSRIATLLPGSSAQLAPLPAWEEGYGLAAGQPQIGTVNVALSPATALTTSGGNCDHPSGIETDIGTGGASCWVDHRAEDAAGARSRDVVSASWDHYSSGTEVQVNLSVPAPFFMSSTPFIVTPFRASASSAQPCQSADCGN